MVYQRSYGATGTTGSLTSFSYPISVSYGNNDTPTAADIHPVPCFGLCNHWECAGARGELRGARRPQIIKSEPEAKPDRLGRMPLKAEMRERMAAPPPPVRAPVPRAHDKRMGFADAPRRPCYRAPRRQP